MIRLGLPRSSQWLDLGAGVRVLAKPITTAIYRAAVSTSYRQAIAIAEERDLIDAAGGTISDIPDPHDRDSMDGLRQQFMLQALAGHAIERWEGVGNDDGSQAADPTPQNISVFIRDFPLLAARFEEKYLSEIAQLAVEGKDSQRAPNGTSATELHTVPDAETPSFLA
jgi:hypothetical protein